jgi:hypothetical protein
LMFATVTPVALMMSPQSPGVVAVRKLTCEAPLQHCGPIVLVVEDVLLVDVVGTGAEVELVELVDVVGVGADVDDVELVDVLDVLVVGTVEPGTDVEVVVSLGPDVLLVELVLVVVDELPPSDVEVVELVLVVELPGAEVDVVELVLVLLVLVVPPSDVEVVDEVLVVVERGMVVVVGLFGSFSDGTQRSEALRHVPRNGFTSCSMNWSWTETVRGTNSPCPWASTTR